MGLGGLQIPPITLRELVGITPNWPGSGGTAAQGLNLGDLMPTSMGGTNSDKGAAALQALMAAAPGAAGSTKALPAALAALLSGTPAVPQPGQAADASNTRRVSASIPKPQASGSGAACGMTGNAPAPLLMQQALATLQETGPLAGLVGGLIDAGSISGAAPDAPGPPGGALMPQQASMAPPLPLQQALAAQLAGLPGVGSMNMDALTLLSNAQLGMAPAGVGDNSLAVLLSTIANGGDFSALCALLGTAAAALGAVPVPVGDHAEDAAYASAIYNEHLSISPHSARATQVPCGAGGYTGAGSESGGEGEEQGGRFGQGRGDTLQVRDCAGSLPCCSYHPCLTRTNHQGCATAHCQALCTMCPSLLLPSCVTAVMQPQCSDSAVIVSAVCSVVWNCMPAWDSALATISRSHRGAARALASSIATHLLEASAKLTDAMRTFL